MKHLLLEKSSELINYPINFYEDGLDKILPDLFSAKEHPSIFIYEHSNTYVSPYGLAFKNGKLIDESVYCLINDLANTYTFFKKILSGKVRKLERECILFHHAWYDNYYHWFTECYPKLILAKDLIKDKVLIMNEKLKPFHKQSLELIECAEIYYCKDDEIIKATKLYIIGQLSNKFGQHHPQVVGSLHTFLTNSLNISEKQSKINLYTSRVRSTIRKCVNEVEVFSLLMNFGFEEVIMDDLSLKEQFSLFSNTANVCGVHGSSFVNAIFMPKGGLIIDLIEKNHQDLCYLNLVQSKGIKYLYFPCNGLGNPAKFRTNNILVDIQTFQKHLDQYLYKV